ncbi:MULTISPECIES: acetyl-CoA carboxylase biotin carboxyl carrier protein [Asticcacaulis]|uniref:acetyl-CoA carboxylase biotin carboxyl carrier protein n=1 Tax=Asticcacaulis TaxID=76890 RepID=UPI001AE89996|nr:MULTISPECIES: acetyl-CoA carboxylase biotin carboxyl carrier protein [Asticcacaulis]MBP2158161.1 acetyl-CoA carboxylase biotin carboxyl carrier protein [Asticcacaulis solisilvae]MDR6799206.1 acetyl-CoA carboxylase biotin carboxyl carrier protein [Asticcacaulis sp. BE141]
MTTSKTPADPIDPKLVRKLADILKETDLSEIEVEQGELKIRVARQLTAAPAVSYVAAPQSPAPAPAAAAPQAVPAATPETAAAPAGAPKDAIKSPMVGTVYLSPQPGAPAFIKVGDKIKQGQTLLIVEAMKTMNPIPSPREGTVAQILVSDAQPVEFGEALVVFE